MSYDIKKFNLKAEPIKEWFKKELTGIRTGRATPNILENILVEVYGSKMPIKQLASIANEDQRTLRIIPYDVSTLKSIEKAITVANLGLSVGADEKGVRVSFPELTGERRESLIKMAKERLEKSRISVRQAREEIWQEIQDGEKDGEITEDQKFSLKEKLQKEIDVINKDLSNMLDNKIEEIQN